MKRTELSPRNASLLALASGVLGILAIRFHVVRTIARFIGQRLADLFFGRVPGGRK